MVTRASLGAWKGPIAATALIVGALIAQGAYGMVHSQSLISSTDSRVLGLTGAEVIVTSGQPLTAYDVQFLQTYGTVVHEGGNQARLVGVSAGGLSSIASQYWVTAVRVERT